MQVYKIGVELMLLGNFKSGVALLSKELTGLNVKVKDLTGGFSKLKLAIGGVAALWAGQKMLSGLASIVDKTKELSHELTQVRKLGQQSETDMKAVYDNAINVGKNVRGISYADIVKIYSNVYDTVGGNRKEALALMAPLAKFDVVAGNTLGKFGQSLDPNFNRDVIKGAEQLGWLTDKQGNYDPKRFAEYQDLLTKLMTISHGAINPATMRAEATTGGPSLMGMDKESLMITAILGQYMGPSRTGTAAMSLMQQFAGGTMFKRNAEAMTDIGLLGKDEWKVSGGRVILTPEARKRLGDLASDPLKLIETLKQDMVDHGIKDQGDQIKELFAVFARQTTQRYMADLLRNLPQILKAVDVSKTALGVDASYGAQQKGDQAQKIADLGVAWDKLLNTVAGPNSANVIAVLDKLTGAIEGIENVVGRHPEGLKLAGEAIGALTVALFGIGSAALIAVLAPLVGTGGLIVGVALALGFLAAVNWDYITEKLNRFSKWYSGFSASVATMLSKNGEEYGDPAALAHKLTLGDIRDALAGKNIVALDRNTKALEDINKALTGVGMGISYEGPGIGGGDGGARLINASYTPASPGLSTSTGGGGSLHSGGGFIASRGGSSSTGGGAIGGPQIPAGVTGNAFIQAMRSPFAKELQDPNVRLQFMGMMLSEGGSNGVMPLADAESAMNRANFAGKSLMQMLHSGFYGPIKHGMLPKFMAEIRRNPALRARLNAYINQALGGSDIIHGHTDQGNLRLGDPGAAWENAHSRDRFGSEIFGDWLFGKGTQQWRENFEARARGSAVPPPKSKESEVHVHKLFVDGREVAHTAMRHIANGGEKAASGGRMYDRSYTRPITI